MKSSKKWIASMLACALALSVNTGVLAAETDTDTAPTTAVVQLHKFDAKQSLLSKIITQSKVYAQHIKEITSKYRIKKGGIYLTEGDFTYLIRLNVKTGFYAELVSYSGNDTEITVPSFVNGKIPVERIYSFGSDLDEEYRYSVKTLNLPETIKTLSGSDTFDLFGLENINVSPENPYITSVDGVVFSKNITKLLALPSARTSYTIPDTVTSIGEFSCYASMLEKVTFPEKLNFIGEYAFFSSPKLMEIKLPETTQYIGKEAFAHCVNLTKAVIPLDVEGIDAYTFSDTAKTFVILSADTIKKGDSVAVAAANPDYINMNYAFYYKKSSDKKWTTIQNFDTSAVAWITPKRSGNYKICVKFKDTDGVILKQYIDIKVLP